MTSCRTACDGGCREVEMVERKSCRKERLDLLHDFDTGEVLFVRLEVFFQHIFRLEVVLVIRVR